MPGDLPARRPVLAWPIAAAVDRDGPGSFPSSFPRSPLPEGCRRSEPVTSEGCSNVFVAPVVPFLPFRPDARRSVGYYPRVRLTGRREGPGEASGQPAQLVGSLLAFWLQCPGMERLGPRQLSASRTDWIASRAALTDDSLISTSW